jgi:hypothetical protein
LPSAALFSQLTELHWNKKRLFQSSTGREQQELSSFIDILSPVNPFTNLPPESPDPPNMPMMSVAGARSMPLWKRTKVQEVLRQRSTNNLTFRPPCLQTG